MNGLPASDRNTYIQQLWLLYRQAIIDYVQSREQTWRDECALRMQVASGRLYDAGIPETRLTNYFDLIAAQYALEEDAT